MDMNALLARKTAERAARGLIADNGIACATEAQKAYYDRRTALKARDDWGNLPPHLEAELIALKAAC